MQQQSFLGGVVRLAQRLIPGQPAPSRVGRAAGQVDLRLFSPAKFVVRDLPHRSEPLELTLDLLSMRLQDGRACTEIHIHDHGLRIEAVLDGQDDSLVVYLGNYFIVPPELRRAGVATACIAAMRQAFQLAAYGELRPEQPAVLEGYFVDRGVDWALSMCAGVLPTKAVPALIAPARLSAGEHRLQMLVPPIPQLYTGTTSSTV